MDVSANETADTSGGYPGNPATYFALHTVTANVLQTLLFATAAWLLYDARRKDRERLISDSATSIAFAGTVRPLLGTAYVLGQLGLGRAADLKAQKDASPDGPHKDGPHKWVRQMLTDEWNTVRFSEQAHCPRTTLQAEADLLDECIRQLVGTVRDWADLFVASELGRQGSYTIQTTRRKLQVMMQDCRSGECPGLETYSDLGKLVAQIAQAFEVASDPGVIRSEVSWATSFYKLSALEPKPALGRNTLVELFDSELKTTRERGALR